MAITMYPNGLLKMVPASGDISESTVDTARNMLPIYTTKVRALLKPWHPLLEFTLNRVDIGNSVEFSVGFRNLYVGQQSIREAFGYVQVPGVFPGFALDHMIAAGEDFKLSESFELFSQYVLRCVCILLSEMVGQDTVAKRNAARLIAPTGRIEWHAVQQWLEWATEPLTLLFERFDASDDQRLRYALKPRRVETEQGTRSEWACIGQTGDELVREHPVSPVLIASLDRKGLQSEVDEFIAAKGLPYARQILEKTLLEGLGQAVYGLRYDLDA